MKEIEALQFNWSKPRAITTKRGDRVLRTTRLAKGDDKTRSFWDIWATHKEEIKEAGYSVNKDKMTGQFELCHWGTDDAMFQELQGAVGSEHGGNEEDILPF